MNSKVLMVASSVVLAVAGIAAIFAPNELLGLFGCTNPGPGGLLLQLLGSAYLSFAITNWTAKDNAIGGIYSRPLSLGNFAHFAIGTLVLMRPAIRTHKAPLIVAAALYAVFAILFGALLFGQGPVGRTSARNS